MLVMGIDSGIGITGCAVIEEEKSNTRLVIGQALKTPTKTPMSERLNILYDKITRFIDEQRPDVAALETLFFNTNVTTAFSVGQARGVIQLALSQRNIPVYEYNPMKIKIAITGYGGASKGQMQRMVSQILRLKKTLTPDDVADAAAVALTHCFSYKLHQTTDNI